ncbi:MAG TPA: TolC family protein [Elusimicrobiales bacterium]|nr:TolC family protein [Elusimicrobiales bacterium]HOL61761.1 TolC family protein [Elusimicrobiales bacterium]HPO94643.1 TolC family protein [Elusimicrobiales bacterium]
MNKKIGTFLFSIFVPCFLISADFTLEDCVKLAFENNPTLKSKLNDLESAKYSYYSSINSYLPKINLSHGFSRSGGDNKTPSNSFSASASLSQNLFDYGSIYSIKSSKINYEIAEINYQSYLVDLRKSLYNAFYNLLFAQESLKVNEKIVQIRKSNSDLINLKYQSGFESKGNMLYAKAQYEMAKLNLEKSKRQLEIASNALKSVIGINTKEIVYAKADISMPNFGFDENKIADYIKSNPQYKNYEKTVILAEEKLKNGEYDWLPKLTFSASAGLSGDREFPDRKNWSLGLNLSLPIFSSGVTYRKNNVAMLKEALNSTKEKFNSFLISLESDILNAYKDYQNAVDSAKTYRILLEANEERYNEAVVKYMAGKMSYIDLENMEQNLIDSRQNYTEYIKNVYIKKVNLEALMSKPLSKNAYLSEEK